LIIIEDSPGKKGESLCRLSPFAFILLLNYFFLTAGFFADAAGVAAGAAPGADLKLFRSWAMPWQSLHFGNLDIIPAACGTP
jgi:hypothetical protein